jgi:class 3 adenylate cyclase
MNAPGDEGQPDEIPASPEALASGNRILAAIVFTDTVGFSALMRKNEDLAMRLVARDLETMKATCIAFGGQVLKTTGDGLLMLFTSAVQAVACALEIQREFHKQNLERPKTEQLRHRIGIHLGDVFQSEGDVMGDGVNIAARLQTEAVPGGICLSQTVYDVVHNRLPFYVNHLGARTLKNIGRVTAYQISPAESPGVGFLWYRWRALLAKLGTATVLLAIIAVAFWLGLRRGEPGAKLLIPKMVQAKVQKPVPPTAPPPQNQPVTPVTPKPVAPPAGTLIPTTEQDFEVVRYDKFRNYDFQGLMDWIAIHDWPEKASNHLAPRCGDMQHLFHWTQEQLYRYSESNPLTITEADGKIAKFWAVPFGGLKMKSEGQTMTIVREQIPPAIMARINAELLKEETLPADERAHFQHDFDVFKETYHLLHGGAAATTTTPALTPGTP